MALAQDILTAVASKVAGLGISLDGPLPVVTRKGVKKEPVVDQGNQVTVCLEEEGDQVEYIAFGNVSVKYPVSVTILTPNARDWASNLPTYLGWRQQIRALFQPPALTGQNPMLGVLGVWDVRVEPDTFLDRDAMAQNYDKMSIKLTIRGTS